MFKIENVLTLSHAKIPKESLHGCDFFGSQSTLSKMRKLTMQSKGIPKKKLYKEMETS